TVQVPRVLHETESSYQDRRKQAPACPYEQPAAGPLLRTRHRSVRARWVSGIDPASPGRLARVEPGVPVAGGPFGRRLRPAPPPDAPHPLGKSARGGDGRGDARRLELEAAAVAADGTDVPGGVRQKQEPADGRTATQSPRCSPAPQRAVGQRGG